MIESFGLDSRRLSTDLSARLPAAAPQATVTPRRPTTVAFASVKAS
jgi:hypothetical protein